MRGGKRVKEERKRLDFVFRRGGISFSLFLFWKLSMFSSCWLARLVSVQLQGQTHTHTLTHNRTDFQSVVSCRGAKSV